MVATSDGALVDVLAFVIAGRETPVDPELVDGSFGGVAVPVPLGIETSAVAPVAPAAVAVLLLVSLSGMAAAIARRRRTPRMAREG